MTRSPFRKTALAAAAAALSLLPVASLPAAEPEPLGARFMVNTVETGRQALPAIAMDADGDFVVVWESVISGLGYEIRGRRYNASGVAQGSEFAVNTATGSDQRRPAVAMDPDGDFVVVWDSLIDVSLEIRGQRFDELGAPAGQEFAVNILTTGIQTEPVVAMSVDGSFMVAWETAPDGVNYDLRQRSFPSSGASSSADNVLSNVAGNQRAVALAAIPGDQYLAAWQSDATGDNEIRARGLFASPGEFTVNTVTTGSQTLPAIGVDGEGDFIVAWQSTASGDDEIRARRYNSLLVPVTSEIPINQYTTGSQDSPVIAMAIDGSYMLAWVSASSIGNGIRGRRYRADGFSSLGEFLIQVGDSPSTPVLSMDADGDATVAWGRFVSTGGGSILARRYQGPQAVDVDVFLSDSADPAAVGSTLRYDIRIGNLQAPVQPTGFAEIDNAVGAATGLRVVAPGTFFGAPSTGTNWSCFFTNSPTRTICDYNAVLPAGGEAPLLTLSRAVSDSPGTSASQVARVSANQLDDNTLNNRAVERTRVVCAESNLRFVSSSYVVDERATGIAIGVERMGGLCGAASVQYDTSSISAVAGLDFTDVGGVLNWNDGQGGHRIFSVPLLDDGLDENNEQLLLTLSNPSGAVLLAPTRVRLTINDDDASPRINFTGAGQTLSEDPALATVSLVLGTVSGRDVAVPLLFSGSASNGTDYAPSASTLIIPAGQTTASTQIEIAEDAEIESDETVILGMGAVSGATPGFINTHTLTIANDDAAALPTVSFSLASSTGDEATTRALVLQLSEASAVPVTVTYTVSGSATLEADYTLSRASPVTINPGLTQIGIQSVPVNDTEDETNETVILTLSGATNAVLGAITVHTRTIIDNDP